MKRLLLLIFAALLSAYAQSGPVSNTASGTISSAGSTCGQTNCVYIYLPMNTASASIQLTGTFSATVQFESSVNGANWQSIASTTGASSATSTGIFSFNNVYGQQFLRARGSAYTSGNVAVSITSSISGGGGGGGGGGITPATCALSASTTPTYDASGGTCSSGTYTAWTIPITASQASATFANLQDGQIYQVTVTHDATSTCFTPAWPTNLMPGGPTTPMCVANETRSIICTYHSGSGNCEAPGDSTGFSGVPASAASGWLAPNANTYANCGVDSSSQRSGCVNNAGAFFGGVQDLAVVANKYLSGIVNGVPQQGTLTIPVNWGPLVFDGSTTTLQDGSTVTWASCATSTAQCATWNVPANVHWAYVQAWSGGGSGTVGFTGGGGNGGGGGGGGYWQGVCPVTAGGTLSVQVGNGGAGTTSSPFSTDGGQTIVGTCFTIQGGYGGNSGTAAMYGGYIATRPRFGWLNDASATGSYDGLHRADQAFCSFPNSSGRPSLEPDAGGCGGGTESTSTNAGSPGAPAIFGGGGGGSGGYNNATGGAGGTSILGGAGGAGGGYTSGGGPVACANGTAPGGGGGQGGAGNASNIVGCNGARGEVRLYYVL